MKAALKLLLPLLFISTALSSLLFTSGCKDDLLTSGDTTTVANTNVKVYRNIPINEYLNASSLSSVDLYTGTTLDADNILRDAELSDSSGFGPEKFYIRSGDGNQDHLAPGQETKFVPFFNTRSATFSQAEFDAITRIDAGHADPLVEADFYKYSTFSFGTSLVSTDIRVYGFWLKGKKISLGLPNQIYGIMYIKSVAGPVGSYQMVVDVKINTAGLNDFRERVPATN
jgi:hypothetical protein